MALASSCGHSCEGQAISSQHRAILAVGRAGEGSALRPRERRQSITCVAALISNMERWQLGPQPALLLGFWTFGGTDLLASVGVLCEIRGSGPQCLPQQPRTVRSAPPTRVLLQCQEGRGLPPHRNSHPQAVYGEEGGEDGEQLPEQEAMLERDRRMERGSPALHLETAAGGQVGGQPHPSPKSHTLEGLGRGVEA